MVSKTALEILITQISNTIVTMRPPPWLPQVASALPIITKPLSGVNMGIAIVNLVTYYAEIIGNSGTKNRGNKSAKSRKEKI